MATVKITVRGLIQGIGFRPFIYTSAKQMALQGWVRNLSDCVEIVVQGTDEQLDRFIRNIRRNHPPLARIESLVAEPVESGILDDFFIRESADISGSVTDISPDIAVCDCCLKDMQSQAHRKKYPFVNCTLCGPRFTIIKGVPYDRPKTTMAGFTMCDSCAREYSDPLDRRFHAQPVACNHCGPTYALHDNGKIISNIDTILETVSRLITNGRIVAIKGVGGFHLACNPFDPAAVARLRERKRRDGKPFALMFRDVEAVKEYAYVDNEEESLLAMSARPIVLLKQRACGDTTHPKRRMPYEVNGGMSTLGCMLPYMPFHYLLFGKLGLPAIVLTSGNVSEEPVVTADAEALETFKDIADAMLVYNREIYNRADDSVAVVFSGAPRVLRRSRGFVPSPVRLPWNVDSILATGAELKSCFALGKGDKAMLSQHIGDLKNLETWIFYRESLGRFKDLYRVTPSLVACDFHPDYLSTRFAAETGLPIVKVQHHHAHVVSCMAEHGIDAKVIGVAFDGTGLGDDMAVWGGEFFICDPCAFKRVAHLRYVPMPGGDKAVEEPWRMAAAHLFDVYGDDFADRYRSISDSVDNEKLLLLASALRNDIGFVRTSSMGRFFDTVSALLQLCSVTTFEAEAAMRLESACSTGVNAEPYDWELTGSGEIDTRTVVDRICFDIQERKTVEEIAVRFHRTIVDMVVKTCFHIREVSKVNNVVLSGGCFQNRFIFEQSLLELKDKGFTVYTHGDIPCNDGGVALGQLAVAACRRSREGK